MIPLANDPRLDNDILFIIFEEDFRFTPEAGDPAWTARGRYNQYWPTMFSLWKDEEIEDDTAAPSSSSAAPSRTSNKIPRNLPVEPTAHAAAAKKRTRAEAGPWVLRNRASAAQWNNVSIFLRDLVAMANLASRARRGDFMFCGWQPHGAGQEDSTSDIRILRSGTMLTMVTKTGFRNLQLEWPWNPHLREPGHVDLCLKKFWWKHPRDGCSYLYPPVGGYTSHISGTSAEFYSTERPNIWMEKFACPGTRKVHDWDPEPRQRKLLAFTSKGKPREVCDIDVEVDDTAVQWLTFEHRKGRITEPTAGSEDEAGIPSSAAASETATVLTARQKRARRAARQRDTFRVYTNEYTKVLRHENTLNDS